MSSKISLSFSSVVFVCFWRHPTGVLVFCSGAEHLHREQTTMWHYCPAAWQHARWTSMVWSQTTPVFCQAAINTMCEGHSGERTCSAPGRCSWSRPSRPRTFFQCSSRKTAILSTWGISLRSEERTIVSRKKTSKVWNALLEDTHSIVLRTATASLVSASTLARRTAPPSRRWRCSQNRSRNYLHLFLEEKGRNYCSFYLKRERSWLGHHAVSADKQEEIHDLPVGPLSFQYCVRCSPIERSRCLYSWMIEASLMHVVIDLSTGGQRALSSCKLKWQSGRWISLPSASEYIKITSQ